MNRTSEHIPLYAIPELKLPTVKEPKKEPKKPDTAKENEQAQQTKVAENEQAQQTAVAENEPDPEWTWGEGDEETMHPFWVVRRMTAKHLAQ